MPINKGFVFWGKTNPREPKEHPYIVMTEPDERDVVLVVNFSKLKEGFSDKLQVEDQASLPDVLTMKSVFAWRECKMLSLDDINTKITSGEFHPNSVPITSDTVDCLFARGNAKGVITKETLNYLLGNGTPKTGHILRKILG